MLQVIIQIILFFIFINFAILLGGLEGWFGWSLGPVISFLWIFAKVFIFLGLGAIIMEVADATENPLLVAGMVFGVLIIFGNVYYGDFQKAFYQKQNIGKVLEVEASKLGELKNIDRTPYIKITSSGLGKTKTFQRKVGKTDIYNEVNYCYAEILNTRKPAFVVDSCLGQKKNLLTLSDLQNQKEIIVEALPKRVYYSELKGLQFAPTQKTFTDYYQKQLSEFWGFVKIANIIGIVFVLLWLVWWVKEYKVDS